MSNVSDEQMDEIIKAASNNDNSHILQLTTEKIHRIKLNILKELQFTHTDLSEYMRKLKQYRYVDNMNELKHGGYIRWIDIRNPTATLSLSGVAIFCDFKITDKGVSIVYTNFFKKRKYEFLMEEAIIFQKLTHQEEVLLHIMDVMKKLK